VEGIELTIKKIELQIKRQELQHFSTTNFWLRNLSPHSVSVVAAVLGVIGVVLAAYLHARANLEMERLKLESAVILKAVETGDKAYATRNLTFLVKAGFIKDSEGRIRALAESEDTVPVLGNGNGNGNGH
jgi:hypothetical protein